MGLGSGWESGGSTRSGAAASGATTSESRGLLCSFHHRLHTKTNQPHTDPLEIHPTRTHSTPRRSSPYPLPIARSLSSVSNNSAITLPAGTAATPGVHHHHNGGASSPFIPLGDDEWDDDDDGLPRWDFSLQGPKDLEALMASAGFHDVVGRGAPTGAGGVVDGDGGDK